MQIAFHVADDSIRFALELQQALLEVAWDPKLACHASAATVTLDGASGPVTIFKGLRVRTVIHTGPWAWAGSAGQRGKPSADPCSRFWGWTGSPAARL